MGWASEEIGRGEEAPDTDGGGGEAIHIRLLPLLHSSPSPPRLATGKGEEEGPPPSSLFSPPQYWPAQKKRDPPTQGGRDEGTLSPLPPWEEEASTGIRDALDARGGGSMCVCVCEPPRSHMCPCPCVRSSITSVYLSPLCVFALRCREYKGGPIKEGKRPPLAEGEELAFSTPSLLSFSLRAGMWGQWRAQLERKKKRFFFLSFPAKVIACEYTGGSLMLFQSASKGICLFAAYT